MGMVSNGSLLNRTNLTQHNDSLEAKHLVQVTLPESVGILLSVVTIFVVNLVGNICAIIAFCKDKKLQTISNYYVLNLTVCDLIIGLFCLPLYGVYVIAQFQWPFGSTLCKMWLVVDFMACAETTLTIILISHDRYLLVSQGLEYGKTQTSQRALMKICASWICSIILYVPSVVMFDIWRGYSITSEFECLPEFHSVVAFNIIRVLLEFVFSFMIISCLNCALYYRIRRRVRRRARLVAMNMFQSNMSLAPPSPSCNSQNSEIQEHPSNIEKFSFSSFRTSLRRSKKERSSVKRSELGSRPLLRRTSSLGTHTPLKGSIRRFRSLRRTRSCKHRSIKRSKSERGANGSCPRDTDDANVVIVITAYDSREAVKQQEDDMELNGIRMALSTSCLYANPAWSGEENSEQQDNTSLKSMKDSLERLRRSSQGSQICVQIRRRSATQEDLQGQLMASPKGEATPRRTSWEALLQSRRASIEFVEIRRKSEPTKSSCDSLDCFQYKKLTNEAKDHVQSNHSSHDPEQVENQPLLANEEENQEEISCSDNNVKNTVGENNPPPSKRDSFKNRMNSLMTETVECNELEISDTNCDNNVNVPNIPADTAPFKTCKDLGNLEMSCLPVLNAPCLLSVPGQEVANRPISIRLASESLPPPNFLLVPQPMIEILPILPTSSLSESNGAQGESSRLGIKNNSNSNSDSKRQNNCEKSSLLCPSDEAEKKEGLKGRRSVSFCDLEGIEIPQTPPTMRPPASPPPLKSQTGNMWHSLDTPVKTIRSVSFRDLKSMSLDSARPPSKHDSPQRGLSLPKRPALKKTRSVNEDPAIDTTSEKPHSKPSLDGATCETALSSQQSNTPASMPAKESAVIEPSSSRQVTSITPVVDSSNLLSVPLKHSRPPALVPSKSTTSIEVCDIGVTEKEEKGRLSKSTSCISSMCVTGSDSWSDHQTAPVPNLDLGPVRKMLQRQRSFTSLASSSPGSDRSGGSGASFFSNASFASIGLNTLRRFLKENGENVRALNKILRRDRRAARSLLLLVIVFFVCWAPISVVNVLGSFCPGCVSKSAYSAACCLVWASAALNPFLYAYTSHRFRVHFQNLLCPCRRQTQTPTQPAGRETTNIL